MTDLLKTRLSRRRVLQAAAIGAVGIDPALRAAVWAQGSDKPEKEEVKIGFIPLTDEEIVSILRNWTVGELSTIASSVSLCRTTPSTWYSPPL